MYQEVRGVLIAVMQTLANEASTGYRDRAGGSLPVLLQKTGSVGR